LLSLNRQEPIPEQLYWLKVCLALFLAYFRCIFSIHSPRRTFRIPVLGEIPLFSGTPQANILRSKLRCSFLVESGKFPIQGKQEQSGGMSTPTAQWFKSTISMAGLRQLCFCPHTLSIDAELDPFLLCNGHQLTTGGVWWWGVRVCNPSPSTGLRDLDIKFFSQSLCMYATTVPEFR
jgi:hypothetical protein